MYAVPKSDDDGLHMYMWSQLMPDLADRLSDEKRARVLGLMAQVAELLSDEWTEMFAEVFGLEASDMRRLPIASVNGADGH